MRKPFLGGNWKMNTDKASAVALASALADSVGSLTDKVDVAVCPPFVYLDTVSQALAQSSIAVSSQDIYFESNGAFTGEISTDMLKDVGCEYVLVGHSERRHVIGETDELINRKVKAAIAAGLKVIFCVGELLAQREAEQTDEVVKQQIEKGLVGIDAAGAANITIAYEPVWAIGTGLTATPAQAQEVHAMIRNLIAGMYSQDFADQVRIQYGGSAKPANAAELMSQPDVDGLLIGGASLKPEDFTSMIASAAESV
ncbi:MAG: triose-phosphate isomerase [Anaerohalosphaeraceae bacterium]|nr:triose-phosphate isomerase [Anaerohalosphaeraceae bacterium]